MVRNLSIRSRILAVLALPVLVLVAAAAVFSWNGFTAARDAAALQRAVQAASDAPALVAALDAERTASTRVLDGDPGASEDLTRARASTDALLDTTTRSLQRVDAQRIGEEPARAVAAALATTGQVRDVRALVDQGRQSATLVSAAYETAIGAQSELPGALAEDADPAGADALRAATAVQQQAGLLADQRDVGTRALSTSGGISTSERSSLLGLTAQLSTNRSEAVRLARSAGVQIPQPSVAYVQLRTALEADEGAGFGLPSVESWRSAVNSEIAALGPSAQALSAAGVDAVAAQAASARTTAVAVAGGALAAVVVPLLIALLIARSITGPLRALTRAAGQVRERLPRLVEAAHSGDGSDDAEEVELEPIPVRGRDEVGRLATAFNEVNATTVQVAREQAALRGAIASTFVTVARRDQALLSRQLSFIDSLERAEEDPQTLEELFTLDHLATRMRRNAESLLVLAGIDSGRRLRAPMPLSDVVRTASSEIEDYRRVDLALGADPAVLGHLALPAAHLLAELLENATRSSDPSTRVRVATSPSPGGVLLTVTDEGIGMTPAQRAEVAARLADPSASAAVGAAELGYFVVGRIARRLGAAVEVHAGVSRGTVVAVSLPSAVFAGAVQAADPGVRAPQPALPVRATATGALPAVRLPESAPAAARGPVPAAARAAAPLAAAPSATTRTGSLPRRAPRAAQAAEAAQRARAATGPLAAAPAAPLTGVPAAPAPGSDAAGAPPLAPSDPAVARRSAVFRTFTARRGELQPPTGAPHEIDLTALRAPLAPVTPAAPAAAAPARPAEPLAALTEAVEPYAPTATATGGAPVLPAREAERARGDHAAPKRGLFARRPARPEDAAAPAPADALPSQAAPGHRTGDAVPVGAPDAAEVRPMTRRELRALEASGRFPAVRGQRGAGQRTGQQRAVLPAAPQTPPARTPAPLPEPVASRPAPAPAAPPLAPVPVPVTAATAGPAGAAGPAGLPAGLVLPPADAPFQPVSGTRAEAGAALPRRSTGVRPVPEAAPERAAGWHAQPGAPLRPLRSMPPATGVSPALASFETGRIPREPYRPAALSTGSAPLVRRAPSGVPAAPSRPVGGQHPPRRREPSEVRSMLAGYTSGVSRARRTPAGASSDTQTKEER
ncbi:HAMP domain-containing protein [Streptomyces sp. NP160]|uniref:sensor histidine kinase n=1 Tax=Streptomyces sp. NP160 TaxID=2586637 RepID=UPI001118A6F1|nr:sensor histidine kinase [Streptomyces sp. NP160]TNM69353.1 HAMP domain-containing protein [Streptomyces sp. NP160]